MKAVNKWLFCLIFMVSALAIHAQSFAFSEPILVINKVILKKEVQLSTQFEHLSFSSRWKNEQMNFSMDRLPIFCRMEEMLYRKSGLNLRINLGSNDQVRLLEGK